MTPFDNFRKRALAFQEKTGCSLLIDPKRQYITFELGGISVQFDTQTTKGNPLNPDYLEEKIERLSQKFGVEFPAKVYLTCPFCNEVDFDAIGLKHHLEWNCDQYRKTPEPR